MIVQIVEEGFTANVSEDDAAITAIIQPDVAITAIIRDDDEIQVVNLVEPGPAGPSGAAYRHVQAVPSATWTIVHNLGVYPNVVVIDTLGRIVEGDMEFQDLNTVVLDFSAAFSGVANVS